MAVLWKRPFDARGQRLPVKKKKNWIATASQIIGVDRTMSDELDTHVTRQRGWDHEKELCKNVVFLPFPGSGSAQTLWRSLQGFM